MTEPEDIRASVQESLEQVSALLRKHELVENLVHRQEGPRQELVETLVHKLHLVELQKLVAATGQLDTDEIADLAPDLPREVILDVFKPVQAHRNWDSK